MSVLLEYLVAKTVPTAQIVVSTITRLGNGSTTALARPGMQEGIDKYNTLLPDFLVRLAYEYYNYIICNTICIMRMHVYVRVYICVTHTCTCRHTRPKGDTAKQLCSQGLRRCACSCCLFVCLLYTRACSHLLTRTHTCIVCF